MKIILYLSLILNVVLVAVATRRGSHSAPPVSVSPVEKKEMAVAVKKEAAPVRSNQSARSKPWRSVESSDPAQFAANLRAIGCPEQTIRDIVTFRISRQFRDRLLALEAETIRQWDPTRNRSLEFVDESNARRYELRDEMMNTLEAALGQSWISVTSSILGWPEPNDPLAPFSMEQRRKIRELERRYTNERIKLNNEDALARSEDPQIQNQLRQLEKEKQSAMAAMLSPQEYEEYLFRNSAAADYVRRDLPQALSEADFRTMVRLANEMEMMNTPSGLPYSDTDNPAAREMTERKAAFDQRLKEVLGNQRINDQQAAEEARKEEEGKRESERSDQEFRTRVEAVAAGAGVSVEDANRFLNHLKEMGPALQPKMDELEKSLSGTPEEKKEQLKAAIRAELEKVATDMLGAKGKVFIDKMVEEFP